MISNVGSGVKPKNIPSGEIEDYHLDLINEYREKALSSLFSESLASLFVLALAVFVFYLGRTWTNSLFESLICCGVGSIFALFSITNLVFIPIRFIRISSYESGRACYAIVRRKWYNALNKNRKYYFTLDLVNENSVMDRVKVSRKIYYSIERGFTVIVVSYDGLTADVIPLYTD